MSMKLVNIRMDKFYNLQRFYEIRMYFEKYKKSNKIS